MAAEWVRSRLCESGTCIEIERDGDTVRIRESANPDVEVVTTLASWQAWLDQARAEERAAIVAALRAEAERRHIGVINHVAGMIERGEIGGRR